MAKKLTLIVIFVMLAAFSTTAALAHGANHGGRRAVRYAACPTESCTLTGLHIHGGNAYVAHYYGDGHDYHGYCGLEACTEFGYHSHDGEYCFGHIANDGHGYHHTGGRHH